MFFITVLSNKVSLDQDFSTFEGQEKIKRGFRYSGHVRSRSELTLELLPAWLIKLNFGVLSRCEKRRKAVIYYRSWADKLEILKSLSILEHNVIAGKFSRRPSYSCCFF